MDLRPLLTDASARAAEARHQVWTSMPGVGPVPRLRRRVIAIVPGVSRVRRLRWHAGTVVPGVGPTARMQRRGRALGKTVRALAGTQPRRHGKGRVLMLGVAGLGGGAAALTKRHRSRQAAMAGGGLPQVRTDRDSGGPTAQRDGGAPETRAAHGTKPSGFEPHD